MICNYRIELRVGKECIAVGPGLVIECAALDFMPASRDEATCESCLGFSQTFPKNTAATCNGTR